MAELSAEQKSKIDAALARAKEPETLMSVAELNLVKKVSWSPSTNKYLVVLDIGTPRFSCLACGVVTENLRAGISRRIAEELRAEFPGAEVEVV